MPPPDLSLPTGAVAPEADRMARIERRLALIAAVLLSLSVFLVLGRGMAGIVARIALLLFPLVGIAAWLLMPLARQQQPGAWRPSRTWLWVGLPLLAYFITALTGMLVHGDSTSVLDKPVRMLVLSLGLFVWLHLRMNAVLFRHIALVLSVLAGFLALGVAFYERYGLGIDRVGVQIFPIQFADLTMSVALICAAWVAGLQKSPLRKLAAIGAAAALAACWMAASRGAFVALVVLPSIIAFASGTPLTLRRALKVLAAVAIVLAAGLAMSSGLRARLGEVSTDLQAYSKGHVNTSVGMRLQMWDNSLRVFAGSPLFGVGAAGYMKAQQRGVDEGRLDPAIMEFNGAHNQFIDALAKGGLLHGLSTLALFLLPWLWFLRWCRQPLDVPLHAVAGFALTSAFPLFALSQHVLNHSSGAMFFSGGIVLFALAAGPRCGTMPASPVTPAAPGSTP